MYSTYKLKDIKLENGRTYNVSLRAKTSTAEEVTADSQEKQDKIQGQIDGEVESAAEAAKRKEEAVIRIKLSSKKKQPTLKALEKKFKRKAKQRNKKLKN